MAVHRPVLASSNRKASFGLRASPIKKSGNSGRHIM